MGLWSKVKGSGTSFKNPNAIGQVRTFFLREKMLFPCSFISTFLYVLIFSQAIAKNLPACDVIESASVAGPGFVNIVLSKSWVAKVCLRLFYLQALHAFIDTTIPFC